MGGEGKDTVVREVHGAYSRLGGPRLQMNQAAALVRRVEDAGGHVLVDGDRVRVKAPKPLPNTLVIEMRVVKAEIVRLFQSRWVDRYEERAGI